MHIRNTVMKLSCACISTHIKLLCLAVAQGTVDFAIVSSVNNWQVGSAILQILSGENHLNDVIS